MDQKKIDILVKALNALDRGDDSIWTNEGLPKVDKVGIEGLTRKDITDVAPNFTRGSEGGEEIDKPIQEQPTELDRLVEERIKLEQFISRLLKEISDAEKVIKSKNQELNVLVNKIEKITPKTSHQDNIMLHIESQKRMREKKAALKKKIFEASNFYEDE
jgi:vacuolar-type H+-ATPase subunit I/STV1